MKDKKIKVTIHVKIDDEYCLYENLTKEQKDLLSFELNDRSLRSIGYTPTNEEIFNNKLKEKRKEALKEINASNQK